MLVFSFGSVLVHAADQCTTISDNNYDSCCSGVASNDSAACKAYFDSNSGDGTPAQCTNITSYVKYTSCCSGVPSNDSAVCNTYNTDNNGEPASILTSGQGNGDSGKPALPANATSVNNPLNIHLENPLAGGGVSDIPTAINKILSVVIRVALPLIIIMFIWSGISFIFARGKPDKIKEARAMFLYTVIGTLLILGAWTITNAIIGTVNSIVN